MPLAFKSTRRRTGFLDPFNRFEPKTLEVELRRDPLTGDSARILDWRARPLGPVDHSLFLERKPPFPCPFCPENLDKMAARFLPREVPEGRLVQGQAVCIPNAFPYESVNAVIILGREHYLAPRDFSPGLLADALWLARRAFARLARGYTYGSVNWNSMMPAGAGLIHPHFQIAAGPGPTRFQAGLLRRVRAYAIRHPGRGLVEDYLQATRRQGERWLGRLGPAAWLTPFAPRALYDVMALLPSGRGLGELSRGQVEKLAQGIHRVLVYFQETGIAAFNFSLHTRLDGRAPLPTMLRLVSRVEIPPLGVDEINFFEKLHDEMVTFIRPEHLAAELRPAWRG